MAKIGALKKLLGLKGESWFWNIYFKIEKHMSLMRFITFMILLLLAIAMVLFANLEIMPREDFQEFTQGKDANAYFLSAYWVITTLTTVGYGDITPVSFAGRLVGMIVMLLGITFVSMLISQLTSRIVAANLGSMFGIARARKRIDLVICGWNPTTEATLEELRNGDMEIVLVDKKNVSESAKANNVMFVMGDPTKPDVLEKANVRHAKNLVLALDADSETLLATHVIRELNPYINLIVKINNHEHVELAKRAGADHVVSPSSIGGRLLSIVADEPHVVEWVTEATTMRRGVTLVEYDIGPESPYVDKTIGQIREAMVGKAKILGIETSAGFERIPSDDTKIETGAKLIAIAKKGA
ncbi:TPA: hypothetical protein HA265_00865 [Candidatus Woesearchaeota archaeon]|nr:hypothetical protein [Candidatus Woesearchaeota archaeon]